MNLCWFITKNFDRDVESNFFGKILICCFEAYQVENLFTGSWWMDTLALWTTLILKRLSYLEFVVQLNYKCDLIFFLLFSVFFNVQSFHYKAYSWSRRNLRKKRTKTELKACDKPRVISNVTFKNFIFQPSHI